MIHFPTSQKILRTQRTYYFTDRSHARQYKWRAVGYGGMRAKDLSISLGA
jgi:predicted RNA-binding Zn ribbon-like protein